ncbi:hypothetical protein BKA67DRAFT_559390 [Truncatella angustata]|uniref:Secreted protein n=1 Tax=Truncatella angustata TaxID=152316 RepID=A0A9P8UN72_9PEZI|nr:uncharacterized protein BKA67DRAFT_559390 [Truncatella angustata]KAH6655061.1 hypothetical protein BKA67DRAFT_559390 [Truncatella angustata]
MNVGWCGLMLLFGSSWGLEGAVQGLPIRCSVAAPFGQYQQGSKPWCAHDYRRGLFWRSDMGCSRKPDCRSLHLVHV